MKSCPSCQHPIQGSFGMVVCSSCGLPVFFDLDGNPQTPTLLDESADAIEDQEPQPQYQPQPQSQYQPQPQSQYQSQYQSQLENQNFELESKDEFETDNSIQESINQSKTDSTIISANDSINYPDDNSINDSVNDSLNVMATEDRIINPLDEVLEYANQPTSEVVGRLSYNLEICGIDTLELKRALIEELRDKRFGWNINEIESRINSGALTLNELNPVQTSLIVKRLRPLNLILTWKQVL